MQAAPPNQFRLRSAFDRLTISIKLACDADFSRNCTVQSGVLLRRRRWNVRRDIFANCWGSSGRGCRSGTWGLWTGTVCLLLATMASERSSRSTFKENWRPLIGFFVDFFNWCFFAEHLISGFESFNKPNNVFDKHVTSENIWLSYTHLLLIYKHILY